MAEITAQIGCQPSPSLTEGIIDEPSRLKDDYKAWVKRAEADFYTLDLPYKEHCIRVSVVAKGPFLTAQNVTMAIPGFAMDNRSYEPSLRDFKPTEDDAFVSVSLLGVGTVFPEDIDPTPQVLSEIYAAAARVLAPRVDPDGGLNIVGNSLAGLVAMGSALVLATNANSPLTADVGLDNSVTWDALNETHTYLYKILTRIQPLGVNVLRFGIATSFSFGPTRNDLVDVLYGIKQEEGFTPADREDRIYTRRLFRQKEFYPFLAKEAAAIDTWDEYFMAEFPSRVTTNSGPDSEDEIDTLTLPGRVVILNSGGDRLLRGLTSQKLDRHIKSKKSSVCEKITLDPIDAHVEKRSARAALIAGKLK